MSDSALSDINPKPAPDGIPTARWRKGEPAGRREVKDLAWYRGHHAGIWDAFLTIKKRYPRVAKQLREAFGMDEKGNLE